MMDAKPDPIGCRQIEGATYQMVKRGDTKLRDYQQELIDETVRPVMTRSITGPTAEAPASDSGNDPDTARRLAQERRIAREQRQAEHEKRAGWIAAENVLNAGNPNDLIRALKSGTVDCLFVHPTRWWLKPSTVSEQVWEGAQFKNGQLWRNGVCLEGPHQKLVINERHWRERLGKSAASVSSADVPPLATEKVRLRNAPETEIREAIKAEYSEAKIAGRKPPNINEIRPRVQERLKVKGFYASQANIARIGEEFGSRRIKPGRTWKSKKKLSRAKARPKKCPPNANF